MYKILTMRKIKKNIEIAKEFKNIIYMVCDPESYYPIYIGQSSTGIHRPMLHIKNKSHSDKLNQWITNLNKKNLSPIIIILESTAHESLLDDKEAYWIKKYIGLGYSLLNKTNININISSQDENILNTHLVEIGNFVKENRLFHKLTQKELALKLNVGLSTLKTIEKGQKNYSINNFINVLTIFNSKLSIINIDND